MARIIKRVVPKSFAAHEFTGKKAAVKKADAMDKKSDAAIARKTGTKVGK